MVSTSLLLSTFPPFPTLTLSAPSDTPISAIPELIAARYPLIPLSELSLARSAGPPLDLSDLPLSELHDGDAPLVTLRLAPRILGGKGGFGSQLRAAGGRMSSQKTSNNDSCRDLNGRRISTVKEAKKLAEYLESEPQRKQATAEAQRAKLEQLERQLGISGSSSASGSGSGDKEPAKVAGTKHRFDDTEYLEQSREIVDNVKSAVAAGLLKKRKKAKAVTPPDASKDSTPAVVAATTGEKAPPAAAATDSASGAPVVAASA